MADSLNAILAKKRIKTWIAPDNIPIGATYTSTINRAIREASCFVLLFSESAQGSNWVLKETERAVNYGQTIFTILLDDVQKNDAFEFMLSSSQAVTIRKIDDNDEKINQLIAEIKKYTDEKLSDEASTQLLVSTKESTDTEEPIVQTQENTESDSIAYFYKNAVMEGSVLKCFEGLDSVSVIIPEGVTDISFFAFSSCSELKNISIPSTVTKIDKLAFCDCPNLQSISVSPENPIFRSENNCCIERETNTLVLGCSKSVIPEGVTAIGKNTFSNGENLTEIRIPASVATIAEGAFKFCKDLQSIQVSAQNLTYYSESNCCIEIKTHRLIIGCKNSIIPEGIVSIATGAFSGCNGLTDVNLPFGITEIGVMAFCHCKNLTKIKIPASVEKIDVLAFGYCENLRYIHISRSIKHIEAISFFGCDNLTDIVLPDSISYIGNSVFSGMLQPSTKRRKIFCEFSQKPDGWDENWTDDSSDVYWKDEWYYDKNGNPVVKS